MATDNKYDYDPLATFMAKRIGHGMPEKCEKHADAAHEYYKAKIFALQQERENLTIALHDIRNYAEKSGGFIRHVIIDHVDKALR